MVDSQNATIELEILEYFKKKYDYLEDYVLQEFFDSSHEILLNLLYPFDYSVQEVPPRIFSRYKGWVRRAMQEFIERNGMTSYINYSENGISVKMDRSQLSQGLISEITPFGGVR